MPTARDLITDILQDLNVVSSGETPHDHDAHFVLRRMNRWINSLALEGMTLFYVLRTLKTLTSGTASYTVGTGGDINITRPDKIEKAGLILDTSADPVTEIPIAVMTPQEWQNTRQKDLESGLVQGVHYDRNWSSGLATLYPWPIPNVGTTQLALYTLQPMTEFADLNTEYTLPPGYELFYETNVLELVAPAFGKAVTADQRIAARDARIKLKRSNIRPERIGVDAALLDAPRSGAWDINLGDYR